jgi:hypothetical protein
LKKPTFLSALTRDANQPVHPRILILASQALNEASALAMMVDTYVALERLITHESCESADGRSMVREDLGALMRALNGEMGRQVDSLVRHTGTLHEVATSEVGLR